MLKSQILAAALCVASFVPAWAAPAPTFTGVLVAHTEYQGKPLDLKMDIFLPPGPKGAPTPVMLARGDNAMKLLDHGIAIASYQYQTNGMPGMLHDLKAYIRFLRAHAAEYNIDPKRIGFLGGSRAGNLAAMLAVTGDNKELEGDIGGNLGQSSMLQAIVINFPLTDILGANNDAKAIQMVPLYLEDVDVSTSRRIVAAYRKRDTKSPYWKYVVRMEKFNPLNYVTKDSPPVFIGHGGDDMGNPLRNSIVLYEKYIEKGARAHLYTYSLGIHGPIGQHIDDETITWITNQLAQNPRPEFAAPLRPQPGPEECEKTFKSAWCTPDPILANRKGKT